MLWGGRFGGGPAEALARAAASRVHFDWRLAPYDLAVSRAHARVLHRAGLLDDDELRQMVGALDDLEADVAAGAFRPTVEPTRTCTRRWSAAWSSGSARSAASCGPAAAATTRWPPTCGCTCVTTPGRWPGRSPTCRRRWSDRPSGTSTPRRRASPTCSTPSRCRSPTSCSRTCTPSSRDVDRLRDWDRRAARSPAGRRRAGRLVAAARPGGHRRASSASTPPAQTRSTPSATATSSRSSASWRRCSACTCPGWARRSCLWTSREFGWVQLDDAYATGSSIMPQKKNPDIAELARGKSGRLIGNLMALLTMLKGLPLAYNRDLQEDKEPVFDAVDTLLVLLPAVSGMVATLTLRRRADGRRRSGRASRSPPTSPSGWCGRASRSATPTRSPAPGATLRGARRRAVGAVRRRAGRGLPGPDP